LAYEHGIHFNATVESFRKATFELDSMDQVRDLHWYTCNNTCFSKRLQPKHWRGCHVPMPILSTDHAPNLSL